MKHCVAAVLASAGLVSSALVWAQSPSSSRSSPFAVDVDQRTFTVTGTVVSARNGSLVVRIDDHHHRIPFALGPAVATAGLRPGSRVRVRYHPTGSTGQTADEVEVVADSPGAGPRG